MSLKDESYPLIQQSYPAPSNSWTAIIGAFLESADLKPSTKESYKRRLKQWLLWIENEGIVAPTHREIVKYKEFIIGRCNSSLTCNNYITSIKSLFKWCHRRGIYPNVCEEVKKLPRPRHHMKEALELNQVKKLLAVVDRDSLEGKRAYALIKILINTGLRGVEVYRANVGDIRKIKGKHVMFVHGKGRSDKNEFVVLVPTVVDAIDDYLLHRVSKSKDEALFTSLSSNYSGRLSKKTLRGIVKKYLKKIGIESDKISSHSMRHTCVTLSLLSGCGLQETKELARHSSIDTTLRYAHNLKLHSNPAFENIDNLIRNEGL